MRFLLLAMVAAVCVPMVALSQSTEELKAKPITTAGGKVGDLLRQWAKEGTAAGNVGDWYDNRDGAHSDLNTSPWPQLQRIVYSPEDTKAFRHWAAARVVRPQVTFGNSSTSAPPTQGGSNPRSYYCSPGGLAFLAKQYESNNVYMYPEHRDHDPGHNGRGEGFGDLYPTNTPYLIISQGSSGSDQPFMRAVPNTLAAFRPEVKAKLIEKGLLMPTVQMILRQTQKHLKDPKDYLTGKAHPSVFEGNAVDDLAMIHLAHAITADKIPPLVKLQVQEEEAFEAGRDFVDPGRSEKLADTSSVIARIFRSPQQRRRLVVNAAGSVDVNGLPLTFTWVVLRGDAKKITITPRSKDGSVAEIVVSHHERRPIAPGSAMESNRVDLGVFAHNGHYYSAPAFITFFTLDNEARIYDDKGQIQEISYGLDDISWKVNDWHGWIGASLADGAIAGLGLSQAHRELLKDAGPKLVALQKNLDVARNGQKDARAKQDRIVEDLKKARAEKLPEEKFEEAKKKVDADAQAAQKTIQAATKEFDDFVNGHGKVLSLKQVAEERLQTLASRSDLYVKITESPLWEVASPDVKKRVKATVDAYHAWGYADPLKQPPTSDFARCQWEKAMAVGLSQIVFAGSVAANFQVNFVDQRLSVAKSWRDVYHYHPTTEKLLGWTRYDGQTKQEFSPLGHLVLTKDVLGRCEVGRIVEYAQEPQTGKGLNGNPLRMMITDRVAIIAYDNDQDFLGRVERVEDRPVKTK